MKRITLQFITALFIITTVAMPVSALADNSTTQNTTQTGASQSTANAAGGAISTLGNYTICLTGVCAALTGITTVLELAVLPLAGFIFWITGQMLDQTIQYSLNIYDVINGSGGASSAILIGWTVIRDLFNMMFIFSIIWIAIETMLDVGKWHGKLVLKNIIIAAILINFSFFITEVLIDAGNIFGAWFYNGIITILGTGTTLSASGISLSSGLATALGIYNFYSINAATNLWGFISLASSTQQFIGALIRLGIIGFSCYIFAYVSVLFISRTVSLLFSLVTSPIGFAGAVLPQTAEYSKKWWKELKDNILLAPIFLLFLYIIMAFINTPIFKDMNLTGAVGATSSFSITPYFKYFLLAFMLKYALSAAKDHAGQLGDAIGKVAGQLGQWAAGAVTGVATGGIGLAARATLGRAGAAVSESSWAKNMEGNEYAKSTNKYARLGGALLSKVGTGVRTTGKTVGEQTFDTGGAATGILKGLGADVKTPSWAKAPKGGFIGAQKANTKAVRERAAELYATPEEKLLVKNAEDKVRVRAEFNVSGTAKAQANVGDQNSLRVTIASREKKSKDLATEIEVARAAKDASRTASLEATKRTTDTDKATAEKDLETKQVEYTNMVKTELGALVAAEASKTTPEAKALADALKATQRLENYAQHIEKGTISRTAASLAGGTVGQLVGGVLNAAGVKPQGVSFTGNWQRVGEEQKKLAKQIREDEKKGWAKSEKEFAAFVKRVADATTESTPPPPPPTP